MGNTERVNWLEFTLLHTSGPCSLRLHTGLGDTVEVGPCLVTDRTIFCPPDTVAPPGTRLVLPSGETVRVVAAHFLDAAGTALPEHWQLDVTRRPHETPRHGLCRPRSALRRV
ncbi:hypothetical protein Acsp01_73250 [Actinoplanes sp. NBRC 101535]|nr:hypothetical protein Acsp01_73250 [Actinoplanes sp. NBRC 101535]